MALNKHISNQIRNSWFNVKEKEQNLGEIKYNLYKN
jgi:hypothetical protein